MRVVLGIVAVLILLLVGGMAAVYSGAINVAASDPHSPALRWLIATTMRQSVRAHAQDIAVPPLGDPILVEEGAKLFQSHCAMCHGAPGAEPQRFARAMRPEPPQLSDAVAEWTSSDLFWIIKHGLKMTGMPAWGATHVDAEIWSMVAFLNQLPTMEPQRYQAIVTPPAPPEPEPVPEEQPIVPPDEDSGQPAQEPAPQ
jgi:mono/diheme cytochrome c family protein